MGSVRFVEVQTVVKVTAEEIADIAVAAFEGGSNYWIKSITYKVYHENPEDHQYDTPIYSDPMFWADGGDIIIKQLEEEPDVTIDMRMLAGGLAKLALHKDQHLTKLIEDHDAGDADAALQLGVFGSIVYG